jgi:hypothetical protein
MESERQGYKGHSIELRAREAEPEAAREAESEAAREAAPEVTSELLIDDEPVRYDQLPDGSYSLHEYAYDWHDNLIDLAKGYIDYRDRTDEIRREREPGSGE